MQDHQYIGTSDSLARLLWISLVVHVLVFSFFGLKLRFSNNDEALIYQSAVKVDLVGLPAKDTEEPVQPSPPAIPQEITANREAATKKNPVVPKEEAIDLKKKQSSAIDRLKALQAIENLKQAEASQSKSQRPIKGNVISAGSAIRGLARGEYDSYISKIDAHIKNNWLLPEWLRNAGLRARALVRFDTQGVILEKKLILSSGNPAYDEAVIRAVEQSSPFPAPPDKFKEVVGGDGIIFQFPD